MGRLRIAGVREFREHAPALLKNGDLVLITRHGELAGMFLPLDRPVELPVELRRELLRQFGHAIADRLARAGLSEKGVKLGFEAWRRRRRRGR